MTTEGLALHFVEPEQARQRAAEIRGKHYTVVYDTLSLYFTWGELAETPRVSLTVSKIACTPAADHIMAEYNVVDPMYGSLTWHGPEGTCKRVGLVPIGNFLGPPPINDL